MKSFVFPSAAVRFFILLKVWYRVCEINFSHMGKTAKPSIRCARINGCHRNLANKITGLNAVKINGYKIHNWQTSDILWENLYIICLLNPDFDWAEAFLD